MRFIEIEALENGAHRNQNGGALADGWAKIPREMALPDTFPFVRIKVSDGVVTSMTANRKAYDAFMKVAKEQEEAEENEHKSNGGE